jgi:hypothetical protein
MDQFRPKRILFVGEQDGPPEIALKRRLSACFDSGTRVGSAYLVRLQYREAGESNVALCLASSEDARADVLEAVQAVFRTMFKPEQSLDIVFLTREQEDQVDRIARPFYRHDSKR